jgi:myo-inositol-1(or 4)-monophosphatase
MNLSQLENDVVALSREVGEFIQHECENFDMGRLEKKGSFNNLVSYVDKEAELKIVKRLGVLLPGSGFLGEEGTETKGTNDYRWIIDPLDGTTNFAHGLPIYSISIGLAKKEEIVLGVVYEVNRKEAFHSSLGKPSFCNGKEISVSAAPTLSESLLATGFPYLKLEKQDAYLEIIRQFLDKTHGVRRLGSAAIDLAYVACGRMEGFFEYNLNPWDVAAGTFIVQQAGGTVTDFKGGNNFIFGRELCAAGMVHSEMLAIIQKSWK